MFSFKKMLAFVHSVEGTGNAADEAAGNVFQIFSLNCIFWIPQNKLLRVIK
jgi:hypothetical protein